ncbi:hypothetical protein ALC53_03205 [Atta colombica]|uniref:Uncharacterized protein n=1 Tax=Atta colombica TaxID=520822 RepID=A0A151I5A2_9HYME|nr:hypothetical protein ALC53_03205 [Atta colombica]
MLPSTIRDRFDHIYVIYMGVPLGENVRTESSFAEFAALPKNNIKGRFLQRGTVCANFYPAIRSYRLENNPDPLRAVSCRKIPADRVLPLNSARRWEANDKHCRRCGEVSETLPHVLCHCGIHSAAIQLRHDAVLHRLWKATRLPVVRVNQRVE